MDAGRARHTDRTARDRRRGRDRRPVRGRRPRVGHLDLRRLGGPPGRHRRPRQQGDPRRCNDRPQPGQRLVGVAPPRRRVRAAGRVPPAHDRTLQSQVRPSSPLLPPRALLLVSSSPTEYDDAGATRRPTWRDEAWNFSTLRWSVRRNRPPSTALPSFGGRTNERERRSSRAGLPRGCCSWRSTPSRPWETTRCATGCKNRPTSSTCSRESSRCATGRASNARSSAITAWCGAVGCGSRSRRSRRG